MHPGRGAADFGLKNRPLGGQGSIDSTFWDVFSAFGKTLIFRCRLGGSKNRKKQRLGAQKIHKPAILGRPGGKRGGAGGILGGLRI